MQLDRNVFGLFSFLEKRTELGTPAGTAANSGDTGNDTSGGINLTWSRSLTPRLSSNATVGYARDISSSQKTLTAGLSMAYLLGEKLTASFNYQFIDVDSTTVGGTYRRNQVEIGLTRSF